MASITYGTAKIDGEASFRIPLGLFFIMPLVVGGCAFFLSEVSGQLQREYHASRIHLSGAVD